MNINIELMKNDEGKEVKNQFLITTPDGEYFQSFEHTIAFRDKYGNITLDVKWKTGSLYRNKFLNESRRKTKSKLKQGIYKLKDLNNPRL